MLRTVELLAGGYERANAIHFAQIAGNASAGAWATSISGDMTLSSSLADPIAVTSDAAAGKARQFAIGQGIRGRYTLVDAGAHGQGATFSLYATLWG